MSGNVRSNNHREQDQQNQDRTILQTRSHDGAKSDLPAETSNNRPTQDQAQK